MGSTLCIPLPPDFTRKESSVGSILERLAENGACAGDFLNTYLPICIVLKALEQASGVSQFHISWCNLALRTKLPPRSPSPKLPLGYRSGARRNFCRHYERLLW